MNLVKLQKDIPFDQFSRQFQVAEIIKGLKTGEKPLKILDVGGYRGHTKDFLTQEEVIVVDLYDVNEEDYIKGSALDLPFDDNTFDYALSFDVLEHIPPADRQKFIDECIRVSRDGIIICAPNRTRLSELAEKKLNDLYKSLHRKHHEWLKEHIEYGIPDLDVVEKKIQKAGLFTTRFYSNKTQLWFAMQQAIFINSKYPLAAGKLIELNEFYNKNFHYDGGGTDETSYRQIICALKNEKNLDSLKRKKGDLNKPIDPALELELMDKINKYTTALVSKTTQLARNYESSSKFYKKQSEEYQKINDNLRDRLVSYEKFLPVKIVNKFKFKPKSQK